MTYDGMLKIILALVIIPILFLEFLHFTSWIAAEPMSNLENSGLQHKAVPADAKSYYPNHGTAIFNKHGTIQEELPIFVFWLFVYVFSIIVYIRVLWYVMFDSKN